MFTKIHYKFYDVLFELFGKLAMFYARKMQEGEGNRVCLKRKYDRCIYIREDILDIMFTLKGLN